MDRNLLILIGAAGATLATSTAWMLFRKKPDARERERRRVSALRDAGRITGGEVEQVDGSVVTYRYEVASVGYVASQDLELISSIDPSKLEKLSGHISVKYERANPSNSMVHAEGWSGLGLREQKSEYSQVTAGG